LRVSGHRARARAGFALAVAVAVASAGLSAITASPAQTATSGTAVSVALVEWKLLPGQATVRAGRITFVVRNDGTMDHEFLILRSDRHHHSLKVDGGKAVEAGRLGEIPRIPSGTSKRITLKVPPGRYVMLCNLIGHYQAGQYAALRVR
jgi:uncharacterized cupredoxin-like copper-binding protein